MEREKIWSINIKILHIYCYYYYSILYITQCACINEEKKNNKKNYVFRYKIGEKKRDNNNIYSIPCIYIYMAGPIYAKDKKRFDFKPKF